MRDLYAEHHGLVGITRTGDKAHRLYAVKPGHPMTDCRSEVVQVVFDPKDVKIGRVIGRLVYCHHCYPEAT